MGDKIVVHCDLTRAEFLSKKEQKLLGKKEGLVVIEKTLSERALKKEFNEIVKALEDSKDKAFMQYKLFMIETVSYAIKKSKTDTLNLIKFKN